MIGTAFLKKKKEKKIFIYVCAGSSLLCKFFSSCGEQGLLSGCGTWASHPSGFSWCGARRVCGLSS